MTKSISVRSSILGLIVGVFMVFTMMPVLTQPAYAELYTIELDGGSYTLTGNNLLVKDGTTEDAISISTDQNITFTGNTEIKLDGHELACASIKSGFEYPNDPDIAKHPWYSYNLTIDGGDKGGSIKIGDPTMEDYAMTAYDLTIRNLDKDSSVSCLRESGNKVAIFAKNDLRIEGIKRSLDICGAAGMEARDGKTIISDVSGLMEVTAMRYGIATDDTNRNTIKISSSYVFIDVEGWDGNCINSGWKKGGISITDSIVVMSNSNDNELTSTSKGGYNALSASGTVDIKNSYVVAENSQKDRPAMFVYEDTGKLIISGESLVGCQNVEGGSASALMANEIKLEDGNRLFMPKGGYIGKTKYNGGSGEKELYTVFDKDGNTSKTVGFGSGKEVINTVSAPAKVLVDTPIHMSGVLKDEDGEPVPNALLWIECNQTFSELVKTNAQGIWEYKGDMFNFSDPGEVTLEIHFERIDGGENLSVKDLVRYLPSVESTSVKVQVISEGYVETLERLELTDLPEGESRKTEYTCGEEFDLDASYVQAVINKKDAAGTNISEVRALEPSGTTITPAVLKYGTDVVSIDYTFEGKTASIDYSVTVMHDWKEATCTEPKTCKGCGVTEGEPLGHTVVIDKSKSSTCTMDGLTEGRHCSVCKEVLEAQRIVSAIGHTWDAGKVTKAATTTTTGTKTYTCMTCKTTKTETIPKLVDPATQLGTDGTALGTGAAAAAADKAITALTTDADPKGSKIAPLLLKQGKVTNASIKLQWKKVKGAKKYVVYGNACGKKNKYKKLATTSSASKTFKKVAGKKVKKGTYYKFMVVALDANNKVVSTSKVVHIASKGNAKKSNPTGLSVKAKVSKSGKALKKYANTKAITLKAGKSTTLKSTVNKAKKTKVASHVKLRYESSNPAVATVNAKGKISAKKAGKCTIYVYAQNGMVKTVKVVVKASSAKGLTAK